MANTLQQCSEHCIGISFSDRADQLTTLTSSIPCTSCYISVATTLFKTVFWLHYIWTFLGTQMHSKHWNIAYTSFVRCIFRLCSNMSQKESQNWTNVTKQQEIGWLQHYRWSGSSQNTTWPLIQRQPTHCVGPYLSMLMELMKHISILLPLSGVTSQSSTSKNSLSIVIYVK